MPAVDTQPSQKAARPFVRDAVTHHSTMPPDAFAAMGSGHLQHDLCRVPEAGFEPGDTLRVCEELADGSRTGRTLSAEITYVTSAGNPCALSPDGLAAGFAIISLAIARMDANEGGS